MLGPFMGEGDILGHETMGVVEEVGAEVTQIRPGERVVIPFNISCGHCHLCRMELYAQCETTQVREHGTGAALFGYTSCTDRCPAARRSTSGCRRRSSPRHRAGGPARRALPLPVRCAADLLAGRAVRRPAEGGSLTVFGLGPIAR
ncbi:alcohol dehydrogenase catalytic domain-containing protein [Nonomuraea dietziae]|uniref:alcohol dehydrogenase catalytic domain-containing protein n=1 Tax=Nonomuraea dietziae TaxID=65515 RepID=UPI0031D978E7